MIQQSNHDDSFLEWDAAESPLSLFVVENLRNKETSTIERCLNKNKHHKTTVQKTLSQKKNNVIIKDINVIKLKRNSR